MAILRVSGEIVHVTSVEIKAGHTGNDDVVSEVNSESCLPVDAEQVAMRRRSPTGSDKYPDQTSAATNRDSEVWPSASGILMMNLIRFYCTGYLLTHN